MMANKKRKLQVSLPSDSSSSGTAPKRSRGIGKELPPSEDETRMMTAFQSDDCHGSRRPDPLQSPVPEMLLPQVLACSPAVSGVLSLLSLKQWLLLRRVSKPWKIAVDFQLRRSLKVLNFEELLGKEEESVKIPLLLRFMAEKAPALREICFISRSREPLATLILQEMKSFKKLAVLDLNDLCPYLPPTDASFAMVLDLMERQAEQLEALTLPCFNWQSLQTSVRLTPGPDKSRLELLFSRLGALKRLDFGCNYEHLHPLLLALPHPDKLLRLKLCPISDKTIEFLQRCSELTHLTLVLGRKNVEEQLMGAILSQLQSLISLETRRHPIGITSLSEQSLKAISGLKQLKEWKVDSDALGQAVSWGRWGFRSLTHLHLCSVVKQSHLDTLNQIPSLIGLDLLTTGAQLRLSLSLPLLQSLSIQAFGGVRNLTFDLEKSIVLTQVHLSSKSHTSFACIVTGLLQRSPRLQELRLDLRLTGSQSLSFARYCPSLEVLDLAMTWRPPWFHLVMEPFSDSLLELQNAHPGTLEAFVSCCPLLKTVKMLSEAILSFNLVSRFPNIRFLSNE